MPNAGSNSTPPGLPSDANDAGLINRLPQHSLTAQVASHLNAPDVATIEERDAMRRVLNDIGTGFWDWDMASMEVWYSSYVFDLLGSAFVSEDTPTPEPSYFWQRIHPDDADRVAAKQSQIIFGETDEYRAEFRMRHDDGRWVWVEAVGRAVTRTNGLATRIAGSFIGIDERKQQEADAAFLMTLVDTLHNTSGAKAVAQLATQALGEYLNVSRINIGRYVDNSRTMIVDVEWVSDPALSLLGEWRPAAGETWFEEAKWTRTDVVMDDVRQGDADCDADFLAFHERVGGIAFVRVPLIIENEIRATMVVSQTTTRNWQPREVSLIKEVAQRLWDSILRARAEEERAASQELLRFALRSAKMSARRLNMETGEVLLSENFRNMIDDDVADDMTTGEYMSCVHPDDMPQLLVCFEEGQTSDHDGDHRYIAADGSVRHIAAFIQFDNAADGSPQSPRLASTILRNITQKREYEAEAQQVRLQLLKHSRLSAMGVMASTLAHELNQPLTVAANYLAMIEHGFETRPDQVKNYAQRAAEKVLEAGKTIRAVRNYAADGAVQSRPEQVHKLVVTALSAMFDFAAPNTITITNAVPEDLTVLVDARMIDHAIANIVRNAVEALGDQPDAHIEISARQKGDTVFLEIADNGPGISDDLALNLFSPFLTTKEKGTGLGLPLCRTMVEANGGKIRLIRQTNKGALFCIALPSADLQQDTQKDN